MNRNKTHPLTSRARLEAEMVGLIKATKASPKINTDNCMNVANTDWLMFYFK